MNPILAQFVETRDHRKRLEQEDAKRWQQIYPHMGWLLNLLEREKAIFKDARFVCGHGAPYFKIYRNSFADGEAFMEEVEKHFGTEFHSSHESTENGYRMYWMKDGDNHHWLRVDIHLLPNATGCIRVVKERKMEEVLTYEFVCVDGPITPALKPADEDHIPF